MLIRLAGHLAWPAFMAGWFPPVDRRRFRV